MRSEAIAGTTQAETPSRESTARCRICRAVENSAVSLALAAMMILPIAEIVLRPTTGRGIVGSSAIVRHLTLIVGMLGGAIAAREARLLSLSTVLSLLKGRLKSIFAIFSSSCAAAITVFLCIASIQFVFTEKESAKILAYGIPLWVVQLVLPFGFALVAARLVWHSAQTWRERLAIVLVASAILLIGAHPPIEPARMVIPALGVLLLATVFGAPVFVTLGGTAVILFWGAAKPIASLTVDHYQLVVNPSLPTVPLFTLAGYFLAEGGASKRLVRVFQALFGQFRGGPAVVTVLLCAFFTSFTGASGVTILALGGLLMPILRAARYSEKAALGLLTGAGSLGLLFPPCLPLILYAVVSRVPMDQMFLGGIIPGIVMLILAAWWGARQGPGADTARQAFQWREARRALWEAKWELLLPVVAFVGLFGGFATAVESAALTALYAFVVEVFIYNDLKTLREVSHVMTECGLLVGGVLIILGVALGVTNYLVYAEVPARAVEWVTASISSPLVFLLLLNLFLLVVGCLMDIFSAIVVVVPLIIPMGEAFGINPVHLGIIFLANLELGYLTPPVGMNLFLASYRFRKPLPEVYRSVVPMLLVLLVGVLLITYVPSLTTTLPRWLGR